MYTSVRLRRHSSRWRAAADVRAPVPGRAAPHESTAQAASAVRVTPEMFLVIRAPMPDAIYGRPTRREATVARESATLAPSRRLGALGINRLPACQHRDQIRDLLRTTGRR